MPTKPILRSLDGTLGIINMTFKDLSKLILLGVPIEKNYVLSFSENKFKDLTKNKISNKNRKEMYSSNYSDLHGQFSGLYGRKLNLVYSRALGYRTGYGNSSANSVLKIKAKIIPINSHSIILNTRFQSLGRYVIWIGTSFFIFFITLIFIMNNIYSNDEFDYSGLFFIISIIIALGLLGSLVTMWTSRISIIKFEKILFKGINYTFLKKETTYNRG